MIMSISALSVLKILQVSRRFKSVSRDTSLWRNLVHTVFPYHHPTLFTQEGEDWRKLFIFLYNVRIKNKTEKVISLSVDSNIYLCDLFPTFLEEMVSIASPESIISRVSQPTWSPYGERVAWIERTRTGTSFIHILNVRTKERSTITEVNISAFYLYWNKDGTCLSWLRVNMETKVLLRVADVFTLQVVEGGIGRPFFYSWSPYSNQLFAYIGSSKTLSIITFGYGSTQKDVRLIPHKPRGLYVPVWCPTGKYLYFSVADDSEKKNLESNNGTPDQQAVESNDEGDDDSMIDNQDLKCMLVQSDLSGNITKKLLPFSGYIRFIVSPNGKKIAYASASQSASSLALGEIKILDMENNNDTKTVSSGPVLAFFFSSNSKYLLFLQVTVSETKQFLQWMCWDGTETLHFGLFRPMKSLMREYLGFFDQYYQSTSFFSPDGEHFVYSGQDSNADANTTGVYVQPIKKDAKPIRVNLDDSHISDFIFFSPQW